MYSATIIYRKKDGGVISANMEWHCPGRLTHCSYPWFSIFSIAGGKGIQYFDESLVITVVHATTGEGHADQPIDAVDRTIAQVNVQVGHVLPQEFIQDCQRLFYLDRGVQVFNSAITELFKEAIR